jgi:hypothetical protein
VEKKPSRKDQKLNTLLVELASTSGSKFSKNLQLLKSEGTIQILHPLAELLLTKAEPEKQEILDLLSDLNESAAADEMITILRDEKFIPVRQALLTTIWNSKLNYSYYLAEFVEIAADGDFMEALDCLTILENMEGPFEERHILEGQLHLKDYLEDPAPKESQKAKIMSEIALFLKDLSALEEDDISSYME